MAKVIRKDPFLYSGPVQDLQVSNTHSYNIEGKGVHNSAGGSLLAYVLNITQMDPIKHGLLFERFMTSKKKCLDPLTIVLTEDGPKSLEVVKVGEKVLTHNGGYKQIMTKTESTHQELVELEFENGIKVTCSPNHLWVVVRDSKTIEVQAKELKETDEFITKL